MMNMPYRLNKVSRSVLVHATHLMRVCLFVSLCLLPHATAHAVDEQINAGMLSDVWFSTLRIEDGDTVVVHGLFQNTSGHSIEASVQVLVDGVELETERVRVAHDAVARIDATWKAAVGTFDVDMQVVDATLDGNTISVNALLAKDATASISIRQKITADYVRSLSTAAYTNTVNKVNAFVVEANKKLDAVKVGLAPQAAVIEQGHLEGGTDQIGMVNGSNRAQVLGVQYSSKDVVLDALKDKPFDVILYFCISALQAILSHWQLTLGTLLCAAALMMCRKLFSA